MAGQGEPPSPTELLVNWARPRRPPRPGPRRVADSAATSPGRPALVNVAIAGKAGSRRLWSLGMPGRSPPPSRCTSTSSWACRAAARDPGQAAGRRPLDLSTSASATSSAGAVEHAARRPGPTDRRQWRAGRRPTWSRRWFGDGSTSTTGTTASSSTASPQPTPGQVLPGELRPRRGDPQPPRQPGRAARPQPAPVLTLWAGLQPHRPARRPRRLRRLRRPAGRQGRRHRRRAPGGCATTTPRPGGPGLFRAKEVVLEVDASQPPPSRPSSASASASARWRPFPRGAVECASARRADWVYLPVEVPAGVGELAVRYGYDRPATPPGTAGNALDIGVFDERGVGPGFGGGRAGPATFAISASGATRATPARPGERAPGGSCSAPTPVAPRGWPGGPR